MGVSFAISFSNDPAPTLVCVSGGRRMMKNHRKALILLSNSSCLSYHEVSDCPAGHITVPV